MTNIERRHLREFCRKHDLDSQEVDSTLTYGENREYLESLARTPERAQEKALDAYEAERELAQQFIAEFIAEHPLTYYLACQMYGETTSAEVGEPVTKLKPFSLAEFAGRNKS